MSTPVTEQPAPSVNGVTVRKLRNTPEDSEFAAKLLAEGFRGKFVHNITEAKLPIAVRNLTACHLAHADDFRDRTFVAELDGSPVGVIGLKFHGDEDMEYTCLGMFMTTSAQRNTCYVDYICVHDRARGKGVGKVLMEKAEAEARRRQCKAMTLYVTTDNRARHLYERQGYSVIATESVCGCLGCCFGPPGSVYEMSKPL